MRAVTLAHYVDVAQTVGLDGARMLRDAGIAPDVLADTESRIPADKVLRLLDRSAAMSGCESFGLMMAERRTFASLGPISLLLERLPQVRAVVTAVIAFRRQLNDVVTIELDEADEACLIKLDLLPDYWEGQMLDLLVGIAYQVMKGASGGRWKPACVHTMRTAPEDQAVWRRVIAEPIEFDADLTGFSNSPSSMVIELPLADKEMARNARHLLRLLPIAEGAEPIADRVSRMIALLLPSGRASVDQVASHLGLSTRSLQRRLDEEGLHYGELLKSVRQDLATAYLANSARPVTSVASLLGYSSPSSFTRWFAGSFGVAPQAWRERQRRRHLTGPPAVWRR